MNTNRQKKLREADEAFFNFLKNWEFNSDQQKLED
jgi:hypothetical protein